MTLTNGSPFPITNDFDWCIYFNQDQAIYNGTEWGNRFGSDIAEGWQVFHVNGYLWKFCPSGKNFKQINPGQQKTWRLQGSDYICQVIFFDLLITRWCFQPIKSKRENLKHLLDDSPNRLLFRIRHYFQTGLLHVMLDVTIRIQMSPMLIAVFHH